MIADQEALARVVVPLENAKIGDLVWDEDLERARPLGRFHVIIRRADGTAELLYNPQERQDELHACPAPNILYGGQAGGGKSHGLRWHGIRACLRTANLRVLLLRREFTDLEKSHLIDLATEVPGEVARYHDQKHRLIFPNGSLLQFGHCHNKKALGAYLSSQWDIILIDEASLFPPEYLRLLRTRLRTKNRRIRPQFIMGTNPGGESHLWIKQRCITKNPPPEESRKYKPDDWHFIASRLEDNAYLDVDEYEEQFSDLSEAEYKAYRLGDWDSFAGQYFTEWRRAVHTVKWDLEIPEWWEVVGGMDWGYSPHPGVVLWGAFDQYARAWIYKELKFYEMSGADVAQAIVDMTETEAERRMIIYGDTQMWAPQPLNGVTIADEINEGLAALGSEIVLMKATKERLNGWHRVHSFLRPNRKQPETGALGPWCRVLRPSPEGEGAVRRGAPYLIETIGSQVHDEIRVGDMKKGATDHACDALRYMLVTREPLTVVPKSEKPPEPHHKRVSNRAKAIMRRLMARHNQELEMDEETSAAALEELGIHEQEDVGGIVIGGEDEIADAWQ